MIYLVVPTNKFSKDLKQISKRGYDLDKIKQVIMDIASNKELSKSYNDHLLNGKYKGKRECHILPDWLLIYEIDDENKILYLARTGTHSDLFK